MEQKEPLIFVPLKPQRLSEEIYRQLKNAILTGHYRPGDRLPSEKIFCETFGVGRPVIREALRFLESSGLVSVRQGQKGGAYVQKIEPSILTDTFEGIVKLDNISLRELMEARLTIELGALPFIMERIQKEDFEALEMNFREVQEHLKQGIRAKKNLAFHSLLIKASHNPLLSKIGEALLDLMSKLLEQYDYDPRRSRVMLDEHRQLINLLKAKEYALIPEMLEKHIIHSVDFSRRQQDGQAGNGHKRPLKLKMSRTPI